jgi:hypothetical protein
MIRLVFCDQKTLGKTCTIIDGQNDFEYYPTIKSLFRLQVRIPEQALVA